MPEDLDETDLKIMRQLEEDGGTSNRQLADKIGISESAVRKRLTKLDSFIERSIKIIPEKVKWKVTCFTMIEFETNHGKQFDAFAAQVEKIANVIFCHKISSSVDEDVLLRIDAESIEEYDQIRERIAQIVPNSRTKTIFSLKTLKHYRLPPDALL